MTQSLLDITLRDHKCWLRTQGKQGKRADFSFMKLEGASLCHADLRGAVLIGADLNDTDFSGADLRGAILAFASLKNACFADADLRQSNLQGANMTHAYLATALLDGADMKGMRTEGAKLPGKVVKREVCITVIGITLSKR